MAVIFGTRVSYRRAGKGHNIVTRDFMTPNHGAEAHDFCKKHVSGFTPEQFKRLKPEDQKKLTLRRVSSPTDVNSVEMYCRITPVWDWHVLEPIFDGAPEAVAA